MLDLRCTGHARCRLANLALIAVIALSPACDNENSGPADGAVSRDDAGDSKLDDAARDLRPDSALIPAEPPVLFPRTGIEASELALVINADDPTSVALGAYYQTKRKIPKSNVVTVKLPVKAKLTQAEFQLAKGAVDKALGPDIQAIALAWLKPYKVECQSITAAFALGFDKAKYCSTPCSATTPSPYYNSTSTKPYTDHQLRPTMMIAAMDEPKGKALIDRGVAADGMLPTGKGFFLRTTDKARSVRWGDFQSTVKSWSRPDGIVSEYIDNSAGSGSNVLSNEKDVLFYLTGLTKVADLATNSYRPGAIADHLTSFGGRLDGTGQMSVVRWLEGGATGSYGTCSEPCNYQQKFPRASVLLRHYFGGATLIEAYWRSVHWPGEGVFVGEPLARPFGSKVAYQGSELTITTTTLQPKKDYELRGKNPNTGAWEVVKNANELAVSTYQRKTVTVDPMQHAAYELVALP
ncbi:MAG: TIGR03790 family protein [Proteobacteria bacterium]|nr:MAG: TIGR03790 family protein [Pseudomonadota bacterium]PIE18232.1 MAG: TIGR03790 family protein [Pseudomonadota bacterium]